MLSYLIKKSLASLFVIAAAATNTPVVPTTAPVTKEPVTEVRQLRQCDKECVTELIRDYAAVYGVDPDYAVAVAKCESELKTTAVGDGGRAHGVFQFHKPTFEMFAKKMGQTGMLEYRDTEDNINVAMWAFAHDKEDHWSCADKVSNIIAHN